VKNKNTKKEKQSSLVFQRSKNCSWTNSKTWVFVVSLVFFKVLHYSCFLEIREFFAT